MSPRLDVSMSKEEIVAFIAAPRVAVLTTLGRDGYPHSSGMWYEPGAATVRMWTYAKSQKAVNARRDPRCALLVEDGLSYRTLRGVLVRGDLQVISATEAVAAIGRALYERYSFPDTSIPLEVAAPEIERQARKRVGLELKLDWIVSWDHTKYM